MAEPGISKRRFRRAPDEKRARILAVGRACFSEKPYEKVTTAEIARVASVSEGTIFHHFGSKLQLLEAVADDYATELAHMMYDGLDSMHESLHVVLARACDFVRDEGILGLEWHESREPLKVVRLMLRKRLVEEGSLVLERWRASNQARAMDARQVAEILFPIFDGMLMKTFLDREPPPRAYLDEVAICLEGALRAPAREH